MRLTILVSLLFLVAASSMTAGTIGNDLIPRGSVDACGGCLFILGANIPSGETVTDWSIYAGAGGNSLTPFLFDTDTAMITGIGATQIGTSGVQSFAFSPTGGSAVAGANTMFGWRDSGNGTIAYDQSSGTVLMDSIYYTPTFAVGTTLSGPTTGYKRYYSIQVTSSSEVPEPCTWMLVGASVLGLATLRRRRR